MKSSLIKKSIAAAGAVSALAPLAAKAAEYNYDYSTSTADSAAAGGVLAAVFIIWGLVAVVALALFIFWIVMLVDAFKRTNWKDDNQKTMWIVIMFVSLVFSLYGVAAIVYYFAVKRALDKPSTSSAPAQK